jgi:hypothetical protein
MTQLVIGSKGQVGSALIEVLSEKYEVDGIDYLSDRLPGKYDVIHICIPYSERFDEAVEVYSDLYLNSGGLIIIHSTVPLGTSAKFNAVHSPIRGVHPHLADGIRHFDKYFGGARSDEAAGIFSWLGPSVISEKSEDTEAMKLWDTTYYGWNIVFEKAVKAYCDEHKLNFKLVYTAANLSYNDGYAELGMEHVRRPVLKDYPGKIGGHCIIPNAKLLGGEIAEFILKKDEEY